MPSGRPKGSRNAQPRSRRGDVARTSSPTLKQLFAVLDRTTYTREYMAVALGVTPTAISYWRSGRTSPRVITLDEFAEVLGYEFKLVKKENADA